MRKIFAISGIRQLLLIPILLCAMSAHGAGITASSILSKMRAATTAKPSLTAVFTINGGQGPVQGSAVISGSKYTMTTPQLEVWYDGKTQWTFLKSSGELSISEPDASELMASNPFSILSAHEKYYNIRRLTDSQGRYRVELIPKKKDTNIEKIVVFVSQSNWMPAAIIVEFDDERAISVVIDNITPAAKKADSVFRYDAKKLPATEIIDLR